MNPLFTDSRRPKLRALAVSFVPETALATAAQWAALEATVERAVAAKPESLRRQLRWLIRLIDAAARIRYGRGLARLNSARRRALLSGLAVSPLLLLRRGIWGLRTLVMLGWYTQPEVAAALGYRASPSGWEARR
ncbi:MAG TPA: gluconate 2-dehydrogenase subunit 3 family protein [Gemmatimonadales bacterium]|nr:gluconate 2-dehydrogenase subunit 3 family protein [Gemmatimonadales bacterium]